MYILSTQYKNKEYFWCGAGQFTDDPTKAKKYQSWEKADYWCNRIKRWKMQFSSLEDLENA